MVQVKKRRWGGIWATATRRRATGMWHGSPRGRPNTCRMCEIYECRADLARDAVGRDRPLWPEFPREHRWWQPHPLPAAVRGKRRRRW